MTFQQTSKHRILAIPAHDSRAWRLPAILFWLCKRRDALLNDNGEIYTNDWAWKRRLISIDRRIACVENEMRAFEKGRQNDQQRPA